MIFDTIVSSTAAYHQVQWSSEAYCAGNEWQTKTVARSTRGASDWPICGLFGSLSVGVGPLPVARGKKAEGKCRGVCIHLVDHELWSALADTSSSFTSSSSYNDLPLSLSLFHFLLSASGCVALDRESWDRGRVSFQPLLRWNCCCSYCCCCCYQTLPSQSLPILKRKCGRCSDKMRSSERRYQFSSFFRLWIENMNMSLLFFSFFFVHF